MNIIASTKGLPDIKDLKPFSEKDMACLDEIREILHKHDAIGRFGVNLLHSHFDISDDEALVEDTDVENRRQTISVIKKKEIPATAIYTNWRFDTHSPSDPVCRIKMQYC